MAKRSALEVNAAIQQLISGEGDESKASARLIIEHCQELKVHWSRFIFTYRGRSPRDISGYTKEAGSVSLRDQGDTNIDYRNFEEWRIGHYRVSRPEKGLLNITHFRDADIWQNDGEEPEQFGLVFDSGSLEPQCFVQMEDPLKIRLSSSGGVRLTRGRKAVIIWNWTGADIMVRRRFTRSLRALFLLILICFGLGLWIGTVVF